MHLVPGARHSSCWNGARKCTAFGRWKISEAISFVRIHTSASLTFFNIFIFHKQIVSALLVVGESPFPMDSFHSFTRSAAAAAVHFNCCSQIIYYCIKSFIVFQIDWTSSQHSPLSNGMHCVLAILAFVLPMKTFENPCFWFDYVWRPFVALVHHPNPNSTSLIRGPCTCIERRTGLHWMDQNRFQLK